MTIPVKIYLLIRKKLESVVVKMSPSNFARNFTHPAASPDISVSSHSLKKQSTLMHHTASSANRIRGKTETPKSAGKLLMTNSIRDDMSSRKRVTEYFERDIIKVPTNYHFPANDRCTRQPETSIRYSKMTPVKTPISISLLSITRSASRTNNFPTPGSRAHSYPTSAGSRRSRDAAALRRRRRE